MVSKMRFLLVFLLICPLAFAQPEKPINEKYSYKGFPYHNLSFKDRPTEEFNDTIIVGSCFYQEWVEGDKDVAKDIFPDGMKGVIFRQCNLDNVYVPPGNKIEGGTNKLIKIQNDRDDWILDDNLKPIKPMNKEERLKFGISIDPKKIPKRKFTREERKRFEELFREEIIVMP